jgi:NAD(P)-dependent dehydrogenase (short-subunit alcohol dehydrogenase family)
MNIVITGSSKGIGFGMARELVKRGHNVFVSSRRADAVDNAVAALNGIGPGKAAGLAADVFDIAQVRAVWDAAAKAFGSVDAWVNNAGITNLSRKLHEVPDEHIVNVVNTNVIGLMNGCKVAIAGMLAQGKGKLFNMEGFGSDGITGIGLVPYGATKYAVRYITKALIKEYKDTPLVIAYLSPGIVTTEFVTKDLYGGDAAALEKRKKFLNMVADREEDVTPFLAEGILRISKSGEAARWLTTGKFITRLIAALFKKRDPFAAG